MWRLLHYPARGRDGPQAVSKSVFSLRSARGIMGMQSPGRAGEAPPQCFKTFPHVLPSFVLMSFAAEQPPPLAPTCLPSIFRPVLRGGGRCWWGCSHIPAGQGKWLLFYPYITRALSAPTLPPRPFCTHSPSNTPQPFLSHTHTDIHLDWHTSREVRRHTHRHMQTRTRMQTYADTETRMQTFADTDTQVQTHIHTQAYADTHRLIHAETHTHTHTSCCGLSILASAPHSPKKLHSQAHIP